MLCLGQDAGVTTEAQANTDTLPLQAANRVMRRVTSEREYTPLASVDHHKLQALDADNRQDFAHCTTHHP